jgi:hypothetical protein
LRTKVDETIPPSTDAETPAYRYQYWLRNPRTGAFLNPAKPDPTVFTELPGGLCTVHEPNERNVLVIVDDGTKVAITYTSERLKGMTINDLRDLIDEFLKRFLRKSITQTQLALNLDGGGSLFMGWLKENGDMQVLAAGGAKKGEPTREYPQPASSSQLREIANIVKHVLA